MVVKTFKLGDTTIEVDDTYFPKNEEERQIVYEGFNKIGCEILREVEQIKGKRREEDGNKRKN